MTRFKSQKFQTKVNNARLGLNVAFKAEKNLRVHSIIALMVVICGLILDVGCVKLSILLLTIGLVMFAEMINSALEFTLDALYKNKFSRLVKYAKDISAGAVLFVSIIAILVGLLVFIPEIINVLIIN